MADAAPAPEPEPAPAPEPEAEGADAEAEETAVGTFAAKVTGLTEIKNESGEENEDILFKMRSKLYKWTKAEEKYGGQMEWKEKGTGECKILKDRDSGKIRLLMRRDKTLKICANHMILPEAVYDLKENVGSDKSWTYFAQDFSDGEVDECTFAIKFGSPENANTFKAKYQECQQEMQAIISGGGDGADDDEDDDDL